MTALECKKHRLSQNQDGGWRLTLNIHPHDEMPDWLLKAAPGQRMGVALVPITDEQNQERAALPKSKACNPDPEAASPAAGHPEGAAPVPPKVKRKWEDMAIVTRAAMMCEDTRAWPILRAITQWKVEDAEDAANAMRIYCGVDRRRDIDENPSARKRFEGIETEYLRATRP